LSTEIIVFFMKSQKSLSMHIPNNVACDATSGSVFKDLQQHESS
jgi:hypothetical protein